MYSRNCVQIAEIKDCVIVNQRDYTWVERVLQGNTLILILLWPNYILFVAKKNRLIYPWVTCSTPLHIFTRLRYI